MIKILVCTDFSTNSKAGIRFALELSHQIACELIFCYIMELMKPVSWSEEKYKHFIRHYEKKKSGELKFFVKRISKSSGIVLQNEHYLIGTGMEPTDAIMQCAKTSHAHYICMSTNGAGVYKKIIGTTASALITNAKIPVFVVPHGYRHKPISSLFFPIDLEDPGYELRTLNRLIKGLQIPLNLCHYDIHNNRKAAAQKMEKLASSYDSDRLKFEVKSYHLQWSLMEHIRWDLRHLKPSLMVLFTRQNLNWFDRLFLSSKTAELSFDTRTPMLVYKKRVLNK